MFNCYYLKGQLISKSPSALQTTDDVSKTTAIAVLYASEYINGNVFRFCIHFVYLLFKFFLGNGFYLNGPQKTKRLIDGKKYKSFNSENENETENDHESIIQYEEGLDMPVEIIIVSLWYWWKEVLFISVITAILINIFIPSRLARIITFIHNRSVSSITIYLKYIQSFLIYKINNCVISIIRKKMKVLKKV